MKEISLKIHLFIPAVISFLVLGMIFLTRKRLFRIGTKKWFWISTTVFFALYLFILCGAMYSGWQDQWNLNKYDLNQDGNFTGSEITPDMEKAMKKLTNDTGLNLSFITGLILSGLIALFVFGIGKISEFIKKRYTKKR